MQGALGHAIHQRISDKRPHRIVTPSIDGQHQAATLPNLLDVVGANFIIANAAGEAEETKGGLKNVC